MLDIHTHLFFPDYDADRKETINRAFKAGLSAMISVSTSPEDHEKALAISALDERIFASVGLHPHWFDERYKIGAEKESGISLRDHWRTRLDPVRNIRGSFSPDNSIEITLTSEIDKLRILAKDNPKIVAIGECGLDYFSRTGDVITDKQKAWQKEGFIAQIRLAQELGLPMIIHCRDAYGDLFGILSGDAFFDTCVFTELPSGSGSAEVKMTSSEKSPDFNERSFPPRETKFILHCYMGDTEETKKFLTLPNVHFSFTGNITYPVKKALEGTSKDIRETVKLIPIERIFMETDCPFLAPVPYRGKRNEPSFVVEVAKKIAEIQGCSEDFVSESVEENRRRVFRMI